MARNGMVIELDRCQGCRACMEACKVENNTPQGNFWMYVFRLEEGEYPDTKVRFLPRPCMHCDNPPCVTVCPVQARFKNENGAVVVDWDKCIGCHYCVVACPYGVNYFNWKDPEKAYYLDWKDKDLVAATGGAIPPYQNPDLMGRYGPQQRRVAGGGHLKGVVEKCSFCVQRVEQNLPPACVEVCPVQALHFGDLDDPNSDVSKTLSRKRSFRLKEELNTQPKVFYVGQSPPGARAREIEAVKAKQ